MVWRSSFTHITSSLLFVSCVVTDLYYLERFHFWLPCHKSGTPFLKPTHIHICSCLLWFFNAIQCINSELITTKISYYPYHPREGWWWKSSIVGDTWVVQTFIHVVAPLCKCTITWTYIFTFVTIIYIYIYLLYKFIYIFCNKKTKHILSPPNVSLASFQCNQNNFGKWSTSLPLSDNRDCLFVCCCFTS